MPKVSRREFLKFLAAGGIAAAAGFTGLNSFGPKGSSIRTASAQTLGDWENGPTTTSHAVHVALLPDGKVLYVAGSGYRAAAKNGPYMAGIWDPVKEDDDELLPRLTKDLFCCGQVALPDGNILLAGGTTKYSSVEPRGYWWGLKAAYVFNWQTKAFEPIPDMAHGRWYPTMVLLSDGRVQVVDGYDEFGYHNLLNEIYEPGSQSWNITYDPNTSRTYTVGCKPGECAEFSDGTPVPGAPGPSYGGTNQGVNPGIGLYPRMHLMPSGLVAQVGQTAGRQNWDPQTGRWRGAGSGLRRSYGTSVLLPLENTPEEKGKILVCGGSEKENPSEAIATPGAEILVPNGFGFTTNPVPDMFWARRYCNPVILPNGKIIIFGGTAEGNSPSLAVHVPEMYSPDNNDWSELPLHDVPRIYHSGALLLQDGRVWTMGTSYDTKPVGDLPAFDLRTDIYKPQYCFEDRPVISTLPPVAEYGGAITITLQTPNASEITAVSLVKVSTTTHHYNTDQRLIWLRDIVLGDNNQITVSAPLNSKLAPPGYYMLHVIKAPDIPSEGKMIKIQFPPVQPVFYNVPVSGGTTSVTLKTDGDTRAGVDVRLGSPLIGNQLKSWTVYLKRVTTAPTGNITAVIRNKSDDPHASPRATFDQPIPANTLTTSYKPYVFTLSEPYTIKANDLILIEYTGPYAVRIDMWNSDKLHGDKTRRVKFKPDGTYGYSSTQDISGIMSSE